MLFEEWSLSHIYPSSEGTGSRKMSTSTCSTNAPLTMKRRPVSTNKKWYRRVVSLWNQINTESELLKKPLLFYEINIMVEDFVLYCSYHHASSWRIIKNDSPGSKDYHQDLSSALFSKTGFIPSQVIIMKLWNRDQDEIYLRYLIIILFSSMCVNNKIRWFPEKYVSTALQRCTWFMCMDEYSA